TEPAEESYECADGSTPVNGVCNISTTITVSSTKTTKCSSGTLSADGKTCVTTTNSESELSCAEGTLSADGKTCILKKNATTQYYCTDGSTPVNNKCPVSVKHTKTVTNFDDPDPECYSYTTYDSISSKKGTYFTITVTNLAGGGYRVTECTITYGTKTVTYYTTEYTKAASTKLVCTDDGYTLNGTACVKTTTPTTTYSCPSGTTISSDKKTCTSTSTPTTTYSCAAGTISSDKKTCTITSTTPINVITTYSCTEGTLNGSICTISKTLKTNYTYYCPFGVLDGDKCVVTTYDEKDPTYECPSGYTKYGTTCYKLVTTTTIEEAETIYKTTSTKTYKWSTSKTLSGWTFTGKTRTVKVSS
ncbi:MAG TPA: hypothetical protein PLC53_02950, partial [Bacilli bacterium]|nr:hypothetical protein [Bacilli bacterium]